LPLDLARFESFCARLPIRDRDTGRTVPFLFAPSQQRIMREVREKQRPNMPLQVILYKSRRTGGSTWAVALLTAHNMAKRGGKSVIVAQLDKTAKELYEERAQPFAEAMQRRGVDIKSDKTQITYNFQGGHYSKLTRATAKTVIGGRGLTASAVLLSEASYYPGEESFVSMVNTVSKDPDNIIIIETTPNGIEGPGQAFYNYWHDAVDGANGFIPIFMPWHEDPGFSLSDEETRILAKDAPKGEYEKWLAREFGCTKNQIAWYRWTMAKACAGNHDLMKQDYPSTPEEGFISSGRPAFDSIELSAAKRDNQKPILRGTIITTEGGIPIFEERPEGEIRVWELPVEKGQYYIGADAAKGVGTGDFAAIVGWNGDTGRMAFRFAERIPPETLAYFLNGLGRYYNSAMINIEFTGGWGATAAQELRDRYYYPQQYLWRGSRDDKVHAKASTALGWETTQRSRRMLFDRFRLALRRGEAHVTDQAFLAQMSRAQMEMAWNWQVIKGHDDIFMAGLLGWIAVEQYHTARIGKGRAETLDKQTGDGNQIPGVSWALDPFTTDMGMLLDHGNRHLKALDAINRSKKKTAGANLEGV